MAWNFLPEPGELQDLDALEASSGYTHWSIDAIPGKSRQYAIRRMGVLLVYLSGDTQTGSVQLAETWDPNDPDLSWVVLKQPEPWRQAI